MASKNLTYKLIGQGDRAFVSPVTFARAFLAFCATQPKVCRAINRRV